MQRVDQVIDKQAAYVLLAFLLPLDKAGGRYWLSVALHSSLYAYFGLYLAVSFRRVYGSSWPVTLLKALAVFVLYTTVLAVSLELASALMTPAEPAMPPAP